MAQGILKILQDETLTGNLYAREKNTVKAYDWKLLTNDVEKVFSESLINPC